MVELTLSQFADQVNNIMPVILKSFMKHNTAEFYKIKLTMPQMAVLMFLDKEGEHKMGDLAKVLNVTTAAVTGIVDKLVRDGYVARNTDPKDRRIIKIKLKPKGIEITKRIIKDRKDMIIKMFGMITQGEREEYLNILNHIREHISK